MDRLDGVFAKALPVVPQVVHLLACTTKQGKRWTIFLLLKLNEWFEVFESTPCYWKVIERTPTY
jgi:hypothetical protein